MALAGHNDAGGLTGGPDPTSQPGLVIESQGLTKRYGRLVAVNELRLRIRRGEVFGLLGPNGAGKTTTLRMLLGLIRPSSGSASVAGHPPGAPEGLARIGALIEDPAHYTYLTGRDNLRVLARYSGVGDDRVEEALALVELEKRAENRVKTYSLGMRQRLGVAAALLKDPEVLILDEPTNGLDAKGMREMGALIRRLGCGSRAVVLSSHLMAEVEQVCDRVGIISRGTLVREGPVGDLLSRRGVVIAADPVEGAERVLSRVDGIGAVSRRDGALHAELDPERLPEVNAALVHAGVSVRELRPLRQSLESAFLEVTGGETV